MLTRIKPNTVYAFLPIIINNFIDPDFKYISICSQFDITSETSPQNILSILIILILITILLDIDLTV